MMREDCWCFEDEEYVAGVLAGKVIMWRLCAVSEEMAVMQRVQFV